MRRLLLFNLIILIGGCANISKGLTSAGGALSDPTESTPQYSSNQTRAISSNGAIVGHENNGKITYNNGEFAQIH